MAKKLQGESLSVSVKVAWGFADLGINIFVYLKSIVIFAFMTQYMGIGTALSGLVTGLVVLTDMVTDPLIGVWSDRSPSGFGSRFGRRRPFMVLGMTLMFAFTYLMFSPPGLTGTVAALWVLLFYALASVGFTLVAVPYGAMATEMTKSRQERTLMMGFRFAFASIGLLLAGLLMTPSAIATGSLTTWLTLGTLMILPITVCVLGTARAPRVDRGVTVPLVRQLTLLRAHPHFIRHVMAYGVMTLGVAILSSGIVFITTDVAIRQVQSDSYATFFTQDFDFRNEAERQALGLVAPEGGWRDKQGKPVPPDAVQQIDPRVPNWFDAIDFQALEDSPYGRIQAEAVQGLLNRAIQTQIIGPGAILVSLAGFFGAVFALFLLGSIISQLLWVLLARTIGRSRALVLGLLLYGSLVCLYWLVLRGGNPTAIVYGTFFLGLCNGAYQNLPWAILPNLIEEAKAQGQGNVEGLFNGIWLSGQKIANSIGPALFGILIALFGFQESTLGFSPQTAQASAALEVCMTILPSLFFLAAIPLFLSIRSDLRR